MDRKDGTLKLSDENTFGDAAPTYASSSTRTALFCIANTLGIASCIVMTVSSMLYLDVYFVIIISAMLLYAAVEFWNEMRTLWHTKGLLLDCGPIFSRVYAVALTAPTLLVALWVFYLALLYPVFMIVFFWWMLITCVFCVVSLTRFQFHVEGVMRGGHLIPYNRILTYYWQGLAGNELVLLVDSRIPWVRKITIRLAPQSCAHAERILRERVSGGVSDM